MSAAQAPYWAVAAMAGVGINDPHVQDGQHIRIIPMPLLGMPLLPFAVWQRPFASPGQFKEFSQGGITFVDTAGQVLTPPFDVTPNNPVTGYFPDGANCIWAEVSAEVRERSSGRTPINVPITPNRRIVDHLNRARGTRPLSAVASGFSAIAAALRDATLDPTRVHADALVDPTGFVTNNASTPAFSVNAYSRSIGTTGLSDRAVNAPFEVAAPHMQRIALVGSARVSRVRWFDANRIKDTFVFARLLNLPIETAPRYRGGLNALKRALSRVSTQRSHRVALHEAPQSPTPSACPPLDVAEESQRAEFLLKRLKPYLDQVLDNLAEPQAARRIVDAFVVNNGSTGTNAIQQFETLSLASVLSAALDPTIGRLFGLLDHDATILGSYTVYGVRGVWQLDEAAFDHARVQYLLNTITADALITSRDELHERASEVPGWKELVVSLDPGVSGPFLMYDTYAVASLFKPDVAPVPVTSLTTQSGPWLGHIDPPDAEREITVRATTNTAAPIAFARRLASGVNVDGLNSAYQDSPAFTFGPARALILPGIDPGDNVADGDQRASLLDRGAPQAGPQYRVAQSDVYGRWSNWQMITAPNQSRPRPPRPTLSIDYTPNPDAEDIGATQQGDAAIIVPVPWRDTLPPGAALLDTLHLQIIIGSGAAQTVSLPAGALLTSDAASEPRKLNHPVAIPLITPAGDSILITVRARWVDTFGTGSTDTFTDAPVATREIHDHRPPPVVDVPETIDYASRADATGLSRYQVNWLSGAHARHFRVYYSDENALLKFLEDAHANTTLGDALAAESNPAVRAGMILAHKAQLDRRGFYQVGPELIQSAGPGEAMGYEHAVSGALSVVSFLKIVTVSDNNVEGDFIASPLVPFAVPSAELPAQPALRVTPRTDLGFDCEITVAEGPVAAAQYRLRRSRASSAVADMPIAQTGPMTQVANGRQVEVVADAGHLDQLPDFNILPYTQYTWVVEVRGANLPGSSLMPDWSTVSAPVSAMFIPPDAPRAVSDLNIDTVVLGRVKIEFDHPDRLIGGAMGSHIFDVYSANGLLGSLSADASPAEGGRQPDGSGRFTIEVGVAATSTDPKDNPDSIFSGDLLRVIAIDPVGRQSQPVLLTAP